MKKGRIFIAAILLFGMVMTGCQEDVNDLDVQPIENLTSDLDGNNGSGGGHNPPPGSD